MSLDIFDNSIRDADIEVARNAAPGLPSTFAENFDASFRRSSEWENSNGYEFARERALAIYYDDIKARTGVQLPLYGMGGAVTLDELNDAQAKIAADHPELELAPLTEQSVDAMALRRMANAHGDAAAIGARERTWGGTLGNLAGGFVGALGDPLQIALLPVGGAGEAGVALRALEFAGIAAGSQAGAAALSYRQREAAVPGSSSEIPGEIIGAGLFGGALGGSLGLLGKFLSAGARKPPTSIAEDINAGASDAQFNTANVFSGVGGEAANRDAVIDTINAILRGDPVKAGDNFDIAHVNGFAESVGVKDRAAATEAAEAVQRPITRDVAPEVETFDRVPNATEDAASYWDERIAAASPEERAALGATDTGTQHSEKFQLVGRPDDGSGTKKFDILSANGDMAGEAKITIDGHSARVDDIRAVGPNGEFMWIDDSANRFGPKAMRDLLRQFRKEHPEVTEMTGLRISGARGAEEEINVALPRAEAPDLAPDQVAKLAADPVTDDAVQRNLDRLRLESPDRDFTMNIVQPDGSVQLVTRKLEDVLDEIDGFERAGKELLACATGMQAAE